MAAAADVSEGLGAKVPESCRQAMGSSPDPSAALPSSSVLTSHRTQPQAPRRTGMAVYKACARNDPVTLLQVIRYGVSTEAVREVDINGWVNKLLRGRTLFQFTVHFLFLVIICFLYALF